MLKEEKQKRVLVVETIPLLSIRVHLASLL
jgi:hypothetical protein